MSAISSQLVRGTERRFSQAPNRPGRLKRATRHSQCERRMLLCPATPGRSSLKLPRSRFMYLAAAPPRSRSRRASRKRRAYQARPVRDHRRNRLAAANEIFVSLIGSHCPSGHRQSFVVRRTAQARRQESDRSGRAPRLTGYTLSGPTRLRINANAVGQPTI